MRIEIIDCVGRPHGIDTSDTEILSKWMLERMAVIKPSVTFPVSIRIYPEVNELGESDWPGESMIFSHQIVNVETLIDTLKRATANGTPQRNTSPH